MLLTFDSLPEFVAKVKALNAQNRYHQHRAEPWTGNITHEEAMEKSLHGDASYVSEAEKLIEKLSVALPTTRMFKTVASPYGGRCHFSDWQIGSPTPMRRRIRASTDYGPLKIVVSTTCSMGIEFEIMEKRGAAILALLLKLQEIRPIELYLLAELYGERDGWHYQQIKVDTKPLDVSIAAFVLCNVGFSRHLTFGLGQKLDGFNGQWPKGYNQEGDYASVRRQRLGLTEEDIVIKEVYMDDKLVQCPIEWITEQLGKYQERSE